MLLTEPMLAVADEIIDERVTDLTMSDMIDKEKIWEVLRVISYVRGEESLERVKYLLGRVIDMDDYFLSDTAWDMAGLFLNSGALRVPDPDSIIGLDGPVASTYASNVEIQKALDALTFDGVTFREFTLSAMSN